MHRFPRMRSSIQNWRDVRGLSRDCHQSIFVLVWTIAIETKKLTKKNNETRGIICLDGGCSFQGINLKSGKNIRIDERT